MEGTDRRIELRASLIQVLEELLELTPEQIPRNADLRADLGMDSLDGADLRAELQDRFGVRLPDHRFTAMRSIDDVLDTLCELAPPR